jgi:hypothetical protein
MTPYVRSVASKLYRSAVALCFFALAVAVICFGFATVHFISRIQARSCTLATVPKDTAEQLFFGKDPPGQTEKEKALWSDALLLLPPTESSQWSKWAQQARVVILWGEVGPKGSEGLSTAAT